VSFIKSDGSAEKLKVNAKNDGTFNFEYTPDEVGDWMVSIRCSGASYIMETVELPLKVLQKIMEPDEVQPEQEDPINDQPSGIPVEYIMIAVGVLIVAIISIIAYLFVKNRNKSSPVVIHD
jgi:hypothetical protein